MDDLDICKRIAEIEGIEGNIYEAVRLSEQWSNNAGTGLITSPQSFIDIYNPLTDDALCFQLMVKYKIKVMYESNPNYYHASKVVHTQGKKPFRIGESDSNPNKAICLAIIKSHKESNNE